MSLAFIAGAIYYTFEYATKQHAQHLWKICALLLLALSANLALLHTFIIIISFVVYIGVINMKLITKVNLYQHLLIYFFTLIGFVLFEGFALCVCGGLSEVLLLVVV